jgi:V8-like Glu-specific endopeptidase
MTMTQHDTAAKRALGRLKTRSSGPLESAAGGPDLRDVRIKSSLEMARERFRQIAERREGDQSAVTAEQAQVLKDAELALNKLANDGDQADVSDRQIIGLEAIVIADGTRPALFVQDDDVDPAVAEAGTWQGAISGLRLGIASAAPSVGRINAEIGFPNYAGTGFVIADGLILTNKHVLEELGDLQPDGTWTFRKPVTIDFAAEFERPRKRTFKVTGVKFASPDRINRQLVLSNLDVAILTVETNNGQENLPPPLPLSRKLSAISERSELYVMGYPARPVNEVGQVLMTVFQDEYFVKRFAPGLVELDADAVDDGGNKRVFTHDASTLGGNSGSCVIEFRIQGKSVVGLHFGGQARAENYAHSVARLEQLLKDHGATFQNA